MIFRSTLALLSALPLAASAHDGHGYIPAQSALHYLADPLHLAPALLLVAAAWWVAKRQRNKQR